MKIPQPYLDIVIDCPECYEKPYFKDTPDMMLGHLLEGHLYTVAEAEKFVQDWIDEFPKDSDNWPMFECGGIGCGGGHGFYRAGGVCGECSDYDRRVDRDD